MTSSLKFVSGERDHWRTATEEARRASERLAHENNRFESDNRLKVFFSMPNIQAGRGELGAERLGRGTRQGMHFACSLAC